MPDPNAPTPGTENQIDYDRLEKLAKEVQEASADEWFSVAELLRWMNPEDAKHVVAFDPATVLALVKKARQRDEAEKEIEERIKECVDHNRILKDEGQTEACARLTAEWIGLRFALDALRRES